MAKIYTIDGLAEQSRRTAIHEWNKRRLANLHAHVSAADVLIRHGVSLQRNGEQPEQISCPFHGNDKKPSAKYFPADGNKHSSVWCFVCHEQWDALTLWKKFNGTERFTEILWQLERAFGVTPPEANGIPEAEEPYDPMVDEVRQLFEVAERRLREYRDLFALEAHLKLGQILDHTQFYLDSRQITLETAKQRLTALHIKIKSKVKERAAAATDTER